MANVYSIRSETSSSYKEGYEEGGRRMEWIREVKVLICSGVNLSCASNCDSDSNMLMFFCFFVCLFR